MEKKTTNIILRITPATHKILVRRAKESHQSLNGLINSVLDAEAKKDLKKSAKSLV